MFFSLSFPFFTLSATVSLSSRLQVFQSSADIYYGTTLLMISMQISLILIDRFRKTVDNFYRSTSDMSENIFGEDALVSSHVSLSLWDFQS